MIRTILLICSFSMLAACGWKSEYPGFSKSRDGYHYKLNKIGESSATAATGDYITVDLVYRTLSDSVFFNARRKFQLTRPAFKGSIDYCFMMLSRGDAASFVISANDFFTKTLETSLPSFFKASDQMIVDVEMIEIQPEQDYLKEKQAFLSWIEDFGEYEKVLLSRYFETEKLEAEPTESGLYVLNLREGAGKMISAGDTVEVHYEGRFLNGKFFDSTKMRNEAFQFVYGQEWQVVEGLEEAIGKMRSGDLSLVILPSKLAFGETGSSTGIVPPFTSLIYEVEIKSVREFVKRKFKIMKKFGLLVVVPRGVPSSLKDQDGYEKETQRLQQYIANNNITVQPTASGMYYIETEPGTGLSVEADDFLVIRFTGRLLTGLIYTSTDSLTAAQNGFYNPEVLYGPYKFQYKRVSLSGLREGLSYMKEGAKATMIIPSNLAFGAISVGVIPAYSTLIYEIELVAVIRDPEAYEAALLDQYLEDKSIIVQPTESGLYYIEVVEGTGSKPQRGQTCKTTFTGKLLDGRVFARITATNPFSFTFQVTEVIPGFEEGISMMKPGGKAIFIIPYKIGYGIDGSQNGVIPPYTTLVYEVELLEVN